MKTITSIADTLADAKDDFDEHTQVPADERAEVMDMFEELLVKLDEKADKYGDEPSPEDGGDGEYED